MKIGLIKDNDIKYFEPILTHEALLRIKADEPLIVIGAVKDGRPEGVLSGFISQDCFYINTLYVAPEYRRQGIAKKLVNALIESLKGKEILVISEFISHNPKEDGLVDFYNSLGFIEDINEEGGAYVANAEAVMSDPIFTDAKYEKIEKGITSYSDCKKSELIEAYEYAKNNFLPLPDEGMFSEDIDSDISMVHKGNAGNIDGYLLADNSIECLPTLAALWNDTKDPRVMSGMMRKAMRVLKLKYPMSVDIAFMIVSEDAFDLVKKLAPDAELISHSFYLFSE